MTRGKIMKLYRTVRGPVLEDNDLFFALPKSWDALINHSDLLDYAHSIVARSVGEPRIGDSILPPIVAQEVWAAGVTYTRSLAARVDESRGGGGSSFYDRVYSAERPELFMKAAPWRVRGTGDRVRIRRDAEWSVPEPELALCINARGEIVGYTIGNDMSSRDIEGENPLYLPQAKTYDGSCAIGPAVLIADGPLAPDTAIDLEICRDAARIFHGTTTISQMRRTFDELVSVLDREPSCPPGSMRLTGTGIVPPADVRLRSGDEIRIQIAPIGVLTNTVE
jgi:2-dehydro-3-deoxy-D-arabinonate dehydratase